MSRRLYMQTMYCSWLFLMKISLKPRRSHFIELILLALVSGSSTATGWVESIWHSPKCFRVNLYPTSKPDEYLIREWKKGFGWKILISRFVRLTVVKISCMSCPTMHETPVVICDVVRSEIKEKLLLLRKPIWFSFCWIEGLTHKQVHEWMDICKKFPRKLKILRCGYHLQGICISRIQYTFY